MRPERGRVLIDRPSGMAALERAFLGHALYAVIIGQPQRKVTPEALAAAVEFECGILPSEMTVEVTGPPFHFFLRFHSVEDCTRVVYASNGPRAEEGLADEFLPDEGVDLTRKHTFATWRGKIDGIGPGTNGKA
ncbi:hypothetical protein ZWY2020_023305 [Hordeum vulgare]|nr:hypothetical protein ZWY2020_023305 [Hordeum vulgare]